MAAGAAANGFSLGVIIISIFAGHVSQDMTRWAAASVTWRGEYFGAIGLVGAEAGWVVWVRRALC
jgi:hypothetical protein